MAQTHQPVQGHKGDQAGWGQRGRRRVGGLKQQSPAPFLTHWLPTFPSGQPGHCNAEFTPYKKQKPTLSMRENPRDMGYSACLPSWPV